MFYSFDVPWNNRYSDILKRLQKELHYSNKQMVDNFPHLIEEQNKENLRLTRRKARFRRYQLIKK